MCVRACVRESLCVCVCVCLCVCVCCVCVCVRVWTCVRMCNKHCALCICVRLYFCVSMYVFALQGCGCVISKYNRSLANSIFRSRHMTSPCQSSSTTLVPPHPPPPHSPRPQHPRKRTASSTLSTLDRNPSPWQHLASMSLPLHYDSLCSCPTPRWSSPSLSTSTRWPKTLARAPHR